jgi:hypothetical protein
MRLGYRCEPLAAAPIPLALIAKQSHGFVTRARSHPYHS